MSSRTLTAAALVLSTTLATGAAAALASACSDDPKPASGDGGDELLADGARRDDPPIDNGPDQVRTRETCVAECRNTYAAGRAKDEAIAKCWDTNCAGYCTSDPTENDEPGDPNAQCQQPVSTDDVSCDVCTQTHCCSQWDGCYNDDDCTAYSQCVTDCPAE
jgi:hypothetical protein